MRTLTVCILTILSMASSALAEDDLMASRYGNTTITTGADGFTNKIHYKADGTFDGTQGAATFSGTWKLDGKGMVCLTTLISGTLCTPLYPHKVGDSWTAGGYKISLVKGIQ